MPVCAHPLCSSPSTGRVPGPRRGEFADLCGPHLAGWRQANEQDAATNDKISVTVATFAEDDEAPVAGNAPTEPAPMSKGDLATLLSGGASAREKVLAVTAVLGLEGRGCVERAKVMLSVEGYAVEDPLIRDPDSADSTSCVIMGCARRAKMSGLCGAHHKAAMDADMMEGLASAAWFKKYRPEVARVDDLEATRGELEAKDRVIARLRRQARRAEEAAESLSTQANEIVRALDAAVAGEDITVEGAESKVVMLAALPLIIDLARARAQVPGLAKRHDDMAASLVEVEAKLEQVIAERGEAVKERDGARSALAKAGNEWARERAGLYISLDEVTAVRDAIAAERDDLRMQIQALHEAARMREAVRRIPEADPTMTLQVAEPTVPPHVERLLTTLTGWASKAVDEVALGETTAVAVLLGQILGALQTFGQVYGLRYAQPIAVPSALIARDPLAMDESAVASGDVPQMGEAS